MLRTYEFNTKQSDCYKEIYENQTLEFVKNMKDKYSKFNNGKITMNNVLKKMDEFIDPSDPDVDEPNSIHAYQTAERIRKKYPNDEQLQITGLIHDLGKILFSFGVQTWAVVGDTFVVGCKIPKTVVYYEHCKNHPDYLNDKLGIYQEKCGVENLHLSYGHDEYLYNVLLHNVNNLEKKYLDIIRFHSFYPWHTSKEYQYFMKPGDEEIMKNVLEFNEFDLYSKEDTDFELTTEIEEYYEKLLTKYFPEPLNW